MKKLLLILIVISASITSCEKEKIEVSEVSVKNFKEYTDTENNNACGEPLIHEGEYVRVDCYIHALNTFENDNRVHLFDSTFMSGTRIELKVIDNNNAIFEKLNEHLNQLNVEDFSKFRITGKIIGIDLWHDDGPPKCNRFAFLEIDSQFNIITIED